MLCSDQDELHLRIAAGEEAAFREAHQLYKDRLFFYGRRFQLEWQEVQDIVAEAFLELWKARASLQSAEHLKNFLYFSARNHALKVRKAKQRQGEYRNSLPENADSEPEIPGQAMIEAEMMQILQQGIENLQPEYRRIFELSWYQELSPQEIARILDANPATVRSQKRRAIGLLREWIQQQGFQPGILILLGCPGFIIIKKILHFLARQA